MNKRSALKILTVSAFGFLASRSRAGARERGGAPAPAPAPGAAPGAPTGTPVQPYYLPVCSCGWKGARTTDLATSMKEAETHLKSPPPGYTGTHVITGDTTLHYQ